MDVKIPPTKLVIAFFVLRILPERKGDLADQSAFFPRQKWTLMGLHGTDGISPRLPIIVSKPSVKHVVTESRQHF